MGAQPRVPLHEAGWGNHNSGRNLLEDFLRFEIAGGYETPEDFEPSEWYPTYEHIVGGIRKMHQMLRGARYRTIVVFSFDQ